MAVKRARSNEPLRSTKPAKRSKTGQLSRPVNLSQRVKTFVCGEGTAGELGLGNVRGAAQAKVPKPNLKLANVVALVAGGMHGLALDPDGRVLTWGGNDHFALGRPTPDDEDEEEDEDPYAPGLNPKEAIPTVLGPFSAGSVVQVTAGDSCSFALTVDGLVYGWGTFRDHNGPRGLTFDTETNTIPRKFEKTPALVPQLQDIVQISAGADFVLALDSQGRVWGWGTNEQLETGHRINTRHHHPDQVLLPHQTALPQRAKIVSIHAGAYHAFAIDQAGRTWAWGLNNFGQTGIAHGAGTNSPIIFPPQKVSSLASYKMKSIAGGAHHSIGLTREGVCLVWGRIDGCQSGLDMQAFEKMPASNVVFDEFSKPRILLMPTTLPIPPCVAIASGTDHSMAITEAGKAFSWGLNVSAQCGQGTEIDVPVAKEITAATVSGEHFVAATAGGQFSMLTSSMTIGS